MTAREVALSAEGDVAFAKLQELVRQEGVAAEANPEQ